MKTQRVKRYVTSDRVTIKGPTEEMIFEQRLEESQDAKHVIIWETSILQQWKKNVQFPDVDSFLQCLRSKD